MAYNARHYRQLRANSSHYRQLGIRRSVIGSVSHSSIRRPADDVPWLDRPGAREALAAHPDLATFPTAVQTELPRWIDDGALHLTGYLSADLVDTINNEVDALLDTGDLDFHFRDRRVMDSAKHSEAVRRAVEDGQLLRLLGFLLGREVTLFRTINFIEGSEQAAHSDAFHMTTEPKGYLVALWVALEDVTPESGPLFYYPGSHRLPYVMSEDLHAGGNPLFVAEGKDEL
jgi:ectoine hydroxylase